MSLLLLAAAKSASSPSGVSDKVAIAALIITAVAGSVGSIILYMNTGRTIAAEEARQAKALEAETQRQAQQLGAEAERLRLQLAHDRQLHDLAELRAVLDEAVQNAETAKNCFLDLKRVTIRDAYDPNLGQTAYSTLQIQRRGVALSFSRLAVRGQGELSMALHGFYNALSTPGINPSLPDRALVRDSWHQAEMALADEQAQFVDKARARVASDLPA
jgi:hypothetical protein